jgi:hypothetical protein
MHPNLNSLAICLLAAVALCLGGCAAKAPPLTASNSNSDGGSISGPSTESTTSGPTYNLTPAGVPDSMFGTDCVGLGSAFTWPGQTGPGSHPSGWAPQGHVGSDVHVDLFRCTRLSWGAFERPVSLLVETHDMFDAPDSCRQGQFDTTFMMNSIWINDTQVAAWLNQTYGMPARYGSIDYQLETTSGLESHRWRWNVPGGEASFISFNTSQIHLQPDQYIHRWYWYNATAVSFINWTDKWQSSDGQGITPGEMHPPMLYSQSYTPNPYLGQGGVLYSESFEGDIHRFGDLACEKPL